MLRLLIEMFQHGPRTCRARNPSVALYASRVYMAITHEHLDIGHVKL